MRRRLRIRTLALVAVAAASLAGATAAVVMASQSSGQGAHVRYAGHSRRHARHAHDGLLTAAAAYLGVSPSTLRSELSSGKSLAQLAATTPGKSEAGLVQALEAAARERLAAASAHLPTRVRNAVDRVHGPKLLQSAATYLGVSLSTLRTELGGGKTLAQLADATAGKSEAGLVEALVAARKTQLTAEVKAGLSQTRAQQIEARLRTRIERQIHKLTDRIP